jgi:DNA polymerase
LTRRNKLTKRLQYPLLVDRRRCCTKSECGEFGLINPATDEECSYFDRGLLEIGPWTAWQGSLDADLMLVGEDWGRVQEFRDQGGRDWGGNPTNKMVRRLLEGIDIEVEPPGWAENCQLYFTNAILCVKPDDRTASSECFANCVAEFLGEQIDLIAPKVVVTLGYQVYKAVMRFYGRDPKNSMTAAVTNATLERIGTRNSSTLVPVFHPGFKARRTRSEREQIEDWRRVRRALDANHA